MMTGEHQPVNKFVSHQVAAGTINHDGVIGNEINKIGRKCNADKIIKFAFSVKQTPAIS